MALVTDRCVYLHLPKCAGISIRHLFKLLKIPHQEIGDQHSHFPELLNFESEELFKKRFIFTFVRHPLTWYQSRWLFRLKNGWKAIHPLDYNCVSNDFQTFMENVLRYKPDGWFSWECRTFIDQTPKPIDFVGRIEFLIPDLIKVLTLAGEKFSERTVRLLPRANDSDMPDENGIMRPSKYWAKYTRQLAKRVLAVEKEVIDRYYYDYDLDIDYLSK